LIVISDYLRGTIEEPAIDAKLKKMFNSMTSPGQWVEILRETLKIYSKSSEKIYMPELLDFCISGKKCSKEWKSFESWLILRNKFSQSLSLKTKDFLRNTWEKWWPEFQKLIEQFFFLTHYEMIIPIIIQDDIIKKVYICTGPVPNFITEADYNLPLTINGVKSTSSLLLLDKRNRSHQLLLYPFMIIHPPTDIYIFHRIEWRKGNIHRVAYANLGEGDDLVICRNSENNEIIKDIESWLQKLGDIGINIDKVTSYSTIEENADRPSSETNDEPAFSSQTVVIRYPAPIAIAYQRFCRQKEYRSRLENLFYALEATIRYLTILGICDLFQCFSKNEGDYSELPNHHAFNFLRQPTPMLLGRWVELLRETARELSKYNSFVQELPVICKPGGELDEKILAYLVELRNNSTHEDGCIAITSEESREVLSIARPILEKMLQKVSFVCNYPLGFVQKSYGSSDSKSSIKSEKIRYYFHSCMGTSVANTSESYVAEASIIIQENIPFIVLPENSKLLYLWPLLNQRIAALTNRRL